MLLGVEERVMMVVTPAEVARRAAVSFVDIPPVPREEPAVETKFQNEVSRPCFMRPMRVDLVGKATVNVEHGNVIDDFDWLCIWVSTGIVGVEAVNVSHEEEVIRIDHPRCDGGEGVVVAKFNFLRHSQSVTRFLT